MESVSVESPEVAEAEDDDVQNEDQRGQEYSQRETA